MKYIDLFAGIGGFHAAADSIESGWECVGAVEIDPFARSVYESNFETVVQEDVLTCVLPEHDLICAGFPCQPWSIARAAAAGRGLADDRADLFFEIVRLGRKYKTEHLLLENVPNLLAHKTGWAACRKVLEDAGYKIGTAVTCATQHGALQRRKRLFIWASRTCDPMEIDKWIRMGIATGAGQVYQTVGDLLEDDPLGTMLGQKTWDFLQRHTEKHKSRGNGFSHNLVKKTDTVIPTILKRYGKDGKEAVMWDGGDRPRRLSPREVARSLGFLDTFKIELSNSRAWMVLGNAVSPLQAGAVMKAMIECIQEERDVG